MMKAEEKQIIDDAVNLNRQIRFKTIPLVRRNLIDKGEWPEDWQPEDRCYYYYSNMVKKWKANPRWTTAHEIYKEMKTYPLVYNSEENKDWDAAHELAWQLFFQIYVMPYELEK